MPDIEGIKLALIKADTAVFRFINNNLHNDLLASAMKFLANDVFLIILVFLGMVYLAKTGMEKVKLNTAFSLWAVIFVNIISSRILKPFFRRLRPVEELEGVNFLVVMKKYGWAFPSTHTAMAAALSAVLWQDYPKARPALVFFTALVMFFCVYTGGHYPLDTAAGLVLGVAAGGLFNFLKNRFAVLDGKRANGPK